MPPFFGANRTIANAPLFGLENGSDGAVPKEPKGEPGQMRVQLEAPTDGKVQLSDEQKDRRVVHRPSRPTLVSDERQEDMRTFAAPKRTVQWRERKETDVRGIRRKARGNVAVKAERNPAQDAVQAWLDVASIVSSPTEQDEARDELASKIGKEVYLDINGWHLYLRDVSVAGTKLHVALAALIADRVSGGLDYEDAVQVVVDKVPIKIGGKKQLPLSQFLPTAAVADMAELVEAYFRDR